MLPRHPLREGDRVLVSVSGQLREAELLRFVDQETRREAHVQLRDGTQMRVDTFVLRRAPRSLERWWWPNDHMRRIALITLLFTALGGVAAILALPLGGGDRRSDAAVPAASAPNSAVGPSRSASASPLKLRTSMLAFNASYGKRWGTTIEADPGDSLKFRLEVVNLSSAPTQPLELAMARRDIGSSDTFVSAFDASRGASAPLLGARVTVRPFSGFGNLAFGKASIVDGTGHVVRELEPPLLGGTLRVPSPLLEEGDFDLGVLAPHRQITLAFTASFATPVSGQLAEGPQILEFRRLANGKYNSTGAAHQGDRLHFSTLLNNVGFRSIFVHARLTITPHRPARFVRVTVISGQQGQRPATFGPAIVNAERGRPISLTLVPHTTRLWSGYDPKCSAARVIEYLPDGLDEGGLDIGPIGGFQPHDSCHGGEFTRFLNFTLAVR